MKCLNFSLFAKKSIDALAFLTRGSTNIGFINNNTLSKIKIYKSDGTVNTTGIQIK